jgi:hypothetical protein
MPFEMDLGDPIENRPVCRHLRNKGMLVNEELDPGGSADIHSGHCWCLLTQGSFGPDQQLVERPQCIEGRSCYVAVL